MGKRNKITCPKCGAPQEDLMPHSVLCYRCYWDIMAPLMREAKAKEAKNEQE
jgi:NMD protein affecting ribosome stability and mRNA decay